MNQQFRPLVAVMLWLSLLAFSFGAKGADRYVGLCNVVFDCASTLHAFSGDITNLPLLVLCETNVTGEAMFSTRLEISPKQLTTHEEKRDANMYKMFQPDRFPQMVALVTNAPLATANLATAGGSANSGTVTVQLTLCGITKEVKAKTSNSKPCDNGWEFDLITDLSLKAFKLKPPSVLFGAVSVSDTVKVKAHVKVQRNFPTPEMNSECDILIVGGGPAGGLAALLLAKAGRAVTLIEAQAVLGERVCGAYLCPAGVALLEELDLRAELTGDMRSLFGMILVAPNLNRLQTRFPSDARYPDFGISLRRPEFDNAILRAATRQGATIRMGERLQKVERTPAGWNAQLADGGIISTQLLIGADGRKSRVAKLLDLATAPWQERVAMHVDVPSLTPTEPYGEMHVFPDGTYVGLNPIDVHTLNVSVLCDPGELKRTTPVDFVNERTQSSAHIRSRIAPLADAASVRATFPAAATVRDVVTKNAALIGDASGFIDPLTGEGIYQALWTARALGNEVSEAWRNDSALNSSLRRYAEARRRQHRGKRWCCQAFQAIIRRPRLSNTVLDLLSFRAGIGDAFIGLIGNNYTPAQACWKMVKALT